MGATAQESRWRTSRWNTLALAAVLVGIALRLWQYGAQPSI